MPPQSESLHPAAPRRALPLRSLLPLRRGQALEEGRDQDHGPPWRCAGFGRPDGVRSRGASRRRRAGASRSGASAAASLAAQGEAAAAHLHRARRPRYTRTSRRDARRPSGSCPQGHPRTGRISVVRPLRGRNPRARRRRPQLRTDSSGTPRRSRSCTTSERP